MDAVTLAILKGRLEQIADELEMGMELDERAQEVRSIIESL